MRLFALLLSPFVALAAAEEPAAYDIRPDHPRVIADAARFAEVKRLTETDPLYAAMRADIRRQADKVLGEAPSKYEIPDGLRLLATSRRVLERIQLLGMAWKLEGDRKYVDRAWVELAAAAAFPDWNPRHFLDTAEMTRAFGTAYDWMHEAWTPAQRATLVAAIADKGLAPGLKVYDGTAKTSKWNLAFNNWNQVCNAGLGIGALAIAEARPAEAQRILREATASLPRAMKGYGPDGAWNEGYGYFHYATGYACAFFATVETATGVDLARRQPAGFDRAALFPVFAEGPLGKVFAYSDGGEKAGAMPEVSWLARKFAHPLAARWQADKAKGRTHPLDLLWTDPRAPTPPAAAQGAHFRGSNPFITLRTAWGRADAAFVGFKGGDNDGGHWHHDSGTFTYDVLGQRWATDLGADNYNLPGYFGKARGDYYRLRAEGHNTLVLNPDRTTGQAPTAKCAFVRTGLTAGRMFGIVDLTPAYAHAATKALRGVRLGDDGQLTIRDEIEVKQPTAGFWFLHLAAPVKVSFDPARPEEALLEQAGRKVVARILSPAGARFEERPASPLPTSPNPPAQNPNAGLRKLCITLSINNKQNINVVLLPVRDGQRAETPPEAPLADWQ